MDSVTLATIITSLILERPLCLDCIGTKAGATQGEVSAAFAFIRAFKIKIAADSRCRACGCIGITYSGSEDR